MEPRTYLHLLTKWLWLLLLGTFVAAAAGLGVSLQMTPQYEADVSLLVSNGQISPNTAYNDLLAGTQFAQTYVQIIQQRPVLEATIRGLGLATTPEALAKRITARVVPNTQLLDLKVRAAAPDQAALIANKLADVFIQQTEARQQGALEASTQYLEDQLKSLEGQVADSERRISELRSQPASAGQKADIAAEQSRLATFQSSYSTVLKNVQDIRLSNASVAGSVSVVQPATPPVRPVSPRIPLNVGLSALLGLLAAAGLVTCFEYFDDKLSSPERVHDSSGLNTLGRLPRVKTAKRGRVSIAASSAESEAYRKLRTNLEFCTLDEPWRTLLVTSPGPGDGKTTVASNLARMMAEEGKNVLLVDLDLRRPSVHTEFGLENFRGVTNLLLDDRADVNAYLTLTDCSGLRLLTAGPLPPNPAELLGSGRFNELLETLRARFDAVVLDSSPVLAVTDPALLSTRVDATLLVVNAQRSRVRQLRATVEALQTVGARLLGVALNCLQADAPGSYYAYYDYRANGPRNGHSMGRQTGSHRGAEPQLVVPLRGAGSHLGEETR